MTYTKKQIKAMNDIIWDNRHGDNTIFQGNGMYYITDGKCLVEVKDLPEGLNIAHISDMALIFKSLMEKCFERKPDPGMPPVKLYAVDENNPQNEKEIMTTIHNFCKTKTVRTPIYEFSTKIPEHYLGENWETEIKQGFDLRLVRNTIRAVGKGAKIFMGKNIWGQYPAIAIKPENADYPRAVVLPTRDNPNTTFTRQ